MIPDICPIRHHLSSLRLGALAVALALAGCTSLGLPERFEIPANSEDFRTRVYAGAAMGNSHLTPDTSGTVFNVDDTDDLGTQIKLGVDVHNALAVELDTSVLGTATLREAGTDVNYSAAAVSALIYGLNGVQLRSRREGWSAYGRLGFGILKKSSAVIALDESGTVPLLGAGAEYGFPNGLGIRGEITRFDEDAVYLGLGAVYRFGLTPREVGGLLAEVAEPALASTETRVAAGGRTLARPGRFGLGADEETSRSRPADAAPVQRVSRWRPPVRRDDRDRDGVLDASDRCPDTKSDVTVDRIGCGLFDAVLSEVVFKSGSNWLTARARAELDRFADELLAFPEARVRVLAHTDSTGPADENLALSARRAEAVVQYLEGRGVSELQLEARGFGETRPLASNHDPDGRQRNRRIEIETLGNLDTLRTAGANRSDDRDEPVRWKPPEPIATAVKVASVVPSPPARPAVSRTATATRAAASRRVVDEPSIDEPPVDEPPVGAARPVPAPVPAPAPTPATKVVARPAPLPGPGFVAGLEINGVIDGVRFVSGSAELLPEARPALARIAGELGKHPGARVAVMAHTDDEGAEADNLALSGERAESVIAHLVDLGIDATRLEPEGYGERLPLVQNVTADDRARNRRVELRVLR